MADTVIVAVPLPTPVIRPALTVATLSSEEDQARFLLLALDGAIVARTPVFFCTCSSSSATFRVIDSTGTGSAARAETERQRITAVRRRHRMRFISSTSGMRIQSGFVRVSKAYHKAGNQSIKKPEKAD